MTVVAVVAEAMVVGAMVAAAMVAAANAGCSEATKKYRSSPTVQPSAGVLRVERVARRGPPCTYWARRHSTKVT